MERVQQGTALQRGEAEHRRAGPTDSSQRHEYDESERSSLLVEGEGRKGLRPGRDRASCARAPDAHLYLDVSQSRSLPLERRGRGDRSASLQGFVLHTSSTHHSAEAATHGNPDSSHAGSCVWIDQQRNDRVLHHDRNDRYQRLHGQYGFVWDHRLDRVLRLHGLNRVVWVYRHLRHQRNFELDRLQHRVGIHGFHEQRVLGIQQLELRELRIEQRHLRSAVPGLLATDRLTRVIGLGRLDTRGRCVWPVEQ